MSSINAAPAAGGIPVANLAGGAAPFTRAQARAAGLKFYYGPACPRGHSRRYVSCGNCVACAIERYARQARGESAAPKCERGIAHSREEARELGLLRYHGAPHHCGSTVRYTKSMKCVPCQLTRSAAQKRAAAGTRRELLVAESRSKAEKLGATFYHGNPHRCGSNLRYTRDRKCVPCQRAKLKGYRAARVAR